MSDNRKPKRGMGRGGGSRGSITRNAQFMETPLGIPRRSNPPFSAIRLLDRLYKGYSVTCSACCAVLGILPNVDDIARAVVAKLTK